MAHKSKERRPKRKDRRRGQAMVEMALILPILLLVILGLIEFGRAFFYYTMVSNAAREGARYGIVHPKDLEGIEDAAEGRLLLIPTDTVTIQISYDDGINPIAQEDIVEGQSRVVVDVSTDFSMMTPLFRPIFPPTTIQLISARTVVAGARARKTVVIPTFTPGGPGPTATPTPTDTVGAPPDTATPTPTDTVGAPPDTATPTPTDTVGPPPDTPTPTPTYTSGPSPTATSAPPTPTATSVPPTATPTLSPTPGSLNIVFASGYPCRGQEKNNNRGKIRVIAYVTDGGGTPVTDATVTVQISGGESATLSHIGGGHYGAGGTCWSSTTNDYTDRDVTVDATKAGWIGDSATDSTDNNPICHPGCP